MRTIPLTVALLGVTVVAAELVGATASAASGAPAVSTANYLPGLDVSRYQNTIDWTKVAASGRRFVIAKATEGRTLDDPNYAANKAGATAAGLSFTAYHFARPDATPNDAIIEADHFVQVAQLGPENLVPALDLEVTGGLSSSALTSWVWAWLQEVSARLGVKPMIYTGPNFWHNQMGDTTVFADAGYRVLWIAHWFVPAPSVPASDWGGNGWTFWQWTDCGSVPGISGCVDLDWYNGTDLGPATIRGLTVSMNSPNGIVTSDPAGIACGTTCSANFGPGSTVTLTATPNPGAAFIGWGGACTGTGTCTVTMNADLSVVATFGFTLSTSLTGPGVGIVTSAPGGIACGQACSASYPTGMAVTLSAAATPGSEFSGWSGDCTGSESCVVTMDTARAVAASFIDDTPPTVSIATPSGLTGAITATFSEIVHQVIAGNVVLRAGGSASNVPATLTCRSTKGTVVNCATGDVVVAQLQPSAPLVPGQQYSAVVDPTGATTGVVDRGGNPAATTSQDFTAATVVEQNSPAVRYQWRTVWNRSALGGSYAVEHLAGAKVSFGFTGSSVTWYTLTGPSQGTASVSIDGRSRGTFDQYASSFHSLVPRSFAGLSPGTHTITITVQGKDGAPAGTDTQVAVDGFRVGQAVVATPSLTTSLRQVRASAASGGTFAESDLAGSSASLTFRGTGVDWYTVSGPDQGQAKIYVDGKALKTIDNYARSVAYGVLRRIGNLADGVHTVRIVFLGQARPAASGRFIAVDRLVVG